MEKFLFSLVIFNIITFGHTFSCTPNSTFLASDGCNTCRCNHEGTNAACTLKYCAVEIEMFNENPLITTTTEEPVSAENGNENKVCTPNEIKMQVETNGTCNRCKCAANGIGWFCTKIPCPPREVHARSVRRAQKCIPGDRWMEECNQCWCEPAGFAACTRVGCPPPIVNQTRPVRQVNTSTSWCTPGSTWMADCNQCWCLPSGIPACTLMGCNALRFRRQINENNCTPGHRWLKDCNECFCTETGIAACTLKGCLGRHDGHHGSSHRSRISPPSSTIPVISADDLKNPNFECTPHEYFKVECNNCKCSSDGKHAKCSKKVCVNGS